MYTAAPFSLLKFQTTTMFGVPKTTVLREPDHDPCFNPNGVFAAFPAVCAGY